LPSLQLCIVCAIRPRFHINLLTEYALNTCPVLGSTSYAERGLYWIKLDPAVGTETGKHLPCALFKSKPESFLTHIIPFILLILFD